MQNVYIVNKQKNDMSIKTVLKNLSKSFDNLNLTIGSNGEKDENTTTNKDVMGEEDLHRMQPFFASLTAATCVLLENALEYRRAVCVLSEHLQMLQSLLAKHSQHCNTSGVEDETRLITWQLVEQRMTILKLLMDVVEHELVYELEEFDRVIGRVRQRTLSGSRNSLDSKASSSVESIKSNDSRACLLSDLCTQLIVPALQSMLHLQGELFKMTQHSFVMATGSMKPVIRKFEEDMVMVLKEMRENRTFSCCVNGKSSIASYNRSGLSISKSLHSSTIDSARLRKSFSSLENEGAKYAVVDHDFVASEYGELSIMEGQRIELTSNNVGDDYDEWWEGKLADGREGWFPCSHVSVIPC